MKNKYRMDITTVHALTKIGRLINSIILILAVLGEFGVPLSGVVAFGGGSAIIVGIAAKDLLANFFGGWVIIMDKPFKVGDSIASPDQDIAGSVEYIGWRSTRIVTVDRVPLYVPNSIFTNITISNSSRRYNRRIHQVLSLCYEDSKKIINVARAVEVMLRTHLEIDQSQAIFINLTKFSSASLDLSISAFTKTTVLTEFQAIQEDVMLKILEIIEANGVALPSSTVTVEVPKGLMVNQTGEGRVC
jgi:MscS family membrane protein